MTRAGIVVVTYNAEREIGPCLDAAMRFPADIVVVDNASSDRTRQAVLGRGVSLIANPWNRGFAAAANQGISALANEYVLLLNPDAQLCSGLDELIAACEAEDIAAASGKLIAEDGNVQRGFQVRRLPTAASLAFEAAGINRIWPSNPVNRRYRCLDADPEAPADVEQPAGAFLMIKRKAWRELGGFDESFRPLWFEDVDFCKRARDRGYRIRYVPAAFAAHKGGYSVHRLSWRNRQGYWYGNLLTYAGKHFRPHALKSVCLAVIAGAVFRAVCGIFLWRSARPSSAFFRVVRLAGGYFFANPGKGAGLPSAS